ncbi:MAG: UvrD-helicase domain-containing protein [Ruminococcus sp.]|nr:UvrD-helicase domain-containing protein [Ruminococcus sp.]
MKPKNTQPNDHKERLEIAENIGVNYFVEASAGSGKTTALVERLLSMVLYGEENIISKISAITYTKAAANEFYKRFLKRLGDKRESLSRSLAENADEQTERQLMRVNDALRDIDLCFMGTIDSFCGALLSEHPSEAGIPIGARVLEEQEYDDALLREFEAISNGEYGKALAENAELFITVCDAPNRAFADIMKSILDHRDHELLLPEFGLDGKTVHFLPPAELKKRFFAETEDYRAAIELIRYANDRGCINKTNMPKYERFTEAGAHISLDICKNGCTEDFLLRRLKDIVKDLGALNGIQINIDINGAEVKSQPFYRAGIAKLFEPNATAAKYEEEIKTKGKSDKEFGGAYTLRLKGDGVDSPLTLLLNEQFGIAAGFCAAAAEKIEKRLRERGELSFFMSLYYLRNMLRRDAEKGGRLTEYISRRHRYFLIDEFQDTDPIQSEIFFYLAADTENGGLSPEWHRCVPRGGSLFIVGDPKQSIYSFKGSDASAFTRVKELFKNEKVGRTVGLTYNFRSSCKLCERFDSKFPAIFGNDGGCGYPPILTDVSADSVTEQTSENLLNGQYVISVTSQKTNGEPETARLISGIVGNNDYLIAPDPEKPPRPVTFGDIMIITINKKDTKRFRSELTACGIPCVVEGSTSFDACDALAELTKLMSAAADLSDGEAVYAALHGGLIGFSDERIASIGRGEKAKAAVISEKSANASSEGKDSGCVLPLARYYSADGFEKYFDERTDSDILASIRLLRNIRSDLYAMPFSAALKKAADDLRVFDKLGSAEMQYFCFAEELLRDKELTGEVTSPREGAEFLEKLFTKENNYERSLSLSETRNAVKIANLHKVKGLESPVVILGIKAKNDTKPIKDALILKSGADGKDVRLNAIFEMDYKQYPDQAMNNGHLETYGLPHQKELKELAVKKVTDEMKRLYYVAATRAQCVLFVLDRKAKSTKKKTELEQYSGYWKALCADEGAKGRKSKDDEYDCPEFAIGDTADENDSLGFKNTAESGAELYDEAEKDSVMTKNRERLSAVSKKLVRPHEQRVPSDHDRESDEKALDADIAEEIPAETAETEQAYRGIRADVKGTLVHRLMEMLVLSRGSGTDAGAVIGRVIGEYESEFTDERRAVAEQMLRFVAETMLEKGGFAQSGGAPQDLMSELSGAEKVFCELPICCGDNDSIVYGIIDMMYVKGGKWHIIDYKTDKNAAEAEKIHRAQLEAYRRAVIGLKGISPADIDAHVYTIGVN